MYQALVRRLTAQTTDYRVLLSTFAEGLFTEMDFQNEALNALRMQVCRVCGLGGEQGLQYGQVALCGMHRRRAAN